MPFLVSLVPSTVIDILIDHADNYNRVHLKMSPGIGGSDYINASFIDVSRYWALSGVHDRELCKMSWIIDFVNDYREPTNNHHSFAIAIVILPIC